MERGGNKLLVSFGRNEKLNILPHLCLNSTRHPVGRSFLSFCSKVCLPNSKSKITRGSRKRMMETLFPLTFSFPPFSKIIRQKSWFRFRWQIKMCYASFYLNSYFIFLFLQFHPIFHFSVDSSSNGNLNGRHEREKETIPISSFFMQQSQNIFLPFLNETFIHDVLVRSVSHFLTSQSLLFNLTAC